MQRHIRQVKGNLNPGDLKLSVVFQTETHTAILAGPVHHRLVVRWVPRQSKSGGVQVRLALLRVWAPGFLPRAPVLASEVRSTLDSSHGPARFPTDTPVQMFVVGHADTSFLPFPDWKCGFGCFNHFRRNIVTLFVWYFESAEIVYRWAICNHGFIFHLLLIFWSRGSVSFRHVQNFIAVTDFQRDFDPRWFSDHMSHRRRYLHGVQSVCQSRKTYLRPSRQLEVKGE